MGSYKIEIDGAEVKVDIIEHGCQICNKISEFETQLKTRRIAGFDVKFNPQRKEDADFFILFTGKNCLIFRLGCYFTIYNDALWNLFSDDTVCFVGTSTRMHDKVAIKNNLLRRSCSTNIPVQCSSVVEVGNLAARVLHSPKLNKSGLEELAEKAGVDSKSLSREIPEGTCLNGEATAFSIEEVKYAIHEAYTCYIIADKLMGLIGA